MNESKLTSTIATVVDLTTISFMLSVSTRKRVGGTPNNSSTTAVHSSRAIREKGLHDATIIYEAQTFKQCVQYKRHATWVPRGTNIIV